MLVLVNPAFVLIFVLDSKNCRCPSKLEVKSSPLTGNSLILVRPSAELTNICTERSERTCVQKSLLTDNHNIPVLYSEDTTDISSDKSCIQWSSIYRGQSKSSRTSSSTSAGKACSRLLSAMNSSQW